jgi:hypothetical protein
MKLNLIFIVMDLLTILVYPFVFVYYKLSQLSKLHEAPSGSLAGHIRQLSNRKL